MILKDYDKQVRSFSRVMAVVFFVIGFIFFIRRKPEFMLLWLTGGCFLVIGIIRPQWLALVYRGWMKLACLLSWVNTRIMLGVIYYCVLTPVSIVMRFLRIDPLESAFSKHKASYWVDRPKKTFNKSDYEHLY
ncbi:MAG: SxtJ family membrane protein [Candidatus Omnitrophota bacterium]